MFSTRQLLSFLAIFAMPQAAFGYTLSHDYYNRYSGGYGADVYATQLVQFAQSETELNLSGVDKIVKEQYGGYVLHTGVGIEHSRFLQTGIYYSNVQQNAVQNRLNELRGHEFGAEAKFVLQSPFVNILFGGGIFYSTQQATREGTDGKTQRTDLVGQGYRGSIDVMYYASSRVSLVLSANQVIGSFRDKSQSQAVSSAQVQSTRAGAGLSLWL